MKQTEISPEEAMKQIQKIFKKRGNKALEMAKREILKEKIECKAVKEALTYFMNEYWLDYSRPALLSMACEAVGGDPELTTFIAVPLILISGAADIHDDIIDQSKRKEERLTVYGKFGKDIALLVGDALLLKGFVLLNKISLEKKDVILDIIKDTFYRLGDAEALELELRERLDVSPDVYLHVVRKKAANVEALMRIGTILGGGSDNEIDALGKYGTVLGMLFAMQDEFVDMLDSKEFIHRVEYECLPLPLLYALQNPKTKEKVARALKEGITKRNSKKLLAAFFKTAEARDFTKTVHHLANESRKQLKKLELPSPYLELLIKVLVEKCQPLQT